MYCAEKWRFAMAKVIPMVLKTMRARRGLTQEDLAHRAKLDKQTVCRLETDKSKEGSTRRHTIDGLAQALRTDPDILTGKSPLPEAQSDDSSPMELSKLNFGVSTQARNAMYLAAERYNVKYADIVELAPFLFCWAAEASLRQRKERLASAEAALNALRDSDSSMEHLQPFDFIELEEKIDAEKTSIECYDIWGKGTEFAVDGDYPFDTPFATFLADLTNEIGVDATFKEYGWGDFPFYRVCAQEAVDLVGGDSELAEAILEGKIALHQMPKELQEFRKTKERVEWARAKLEDFQRHFRRGPL
jgi:transcriptional regulator with XRE-family HTH domain